MANAIAVVALTPAMIALGIIVVAVAWLVMLWIAICYMFSKASGWSRLQQLYQTGAFHGSISSVSGRLGRSRFRGALFAGAAPSGLYLKLAAPFRMFARPVLVPWHDITVSPPSADPISLITFDIPNAGTSLRVRQDVARKLLEGQRGIR